MELGLVNVLEINLLLFSWPPALALSFQIHQREIAPQIIRWSNGNTISYLSIAFFFGLCPVIFTELITFSKLDVNFLLDDLVHLIGKPSTSDSFELPTHLGDYPAFCSSKSEAIFSVVFSVIFLPRLSS